MTSTAAARPGKSSIRWTVCALLFFATTVSYVDRQVLSILAKTLETSIGWNSIQYGYITASFQATYGIGLLFAGRVIDRLGTRTGLRAGHGGVERGCHRPCGGRAARSCSGSRAPCWASENPPIFPPASRSWPSGFPGRSGPSPPPSSIRGRPWAPCWRPLTVPWLAIAFGWQAAFLATGALGFVWVIFWLSMYKTAAGARPGIRRGAGPHRKRPAG